MKNDLLNAFNKFKSNDKYTCVLCKNDAIITSTESGIKPLMMWVKSGDDYKGFSAADKIVGKAAAFLYVLLGVNEVYADVMSEKAVSVFESYNIKYSYDTLTKKIINRKGTGPCPMEEAAKNANDPKEAFELLKEKLKALKNKPIS